MKSFAQKEKSFSQKLFVLLTRSDLRDFLHHPHKSITFFFYVNENFIATSIQRCRACCFKFSHPLIDVFIVESFSIPLSLSFGIWQPHQPQAATLKWKCASEMIFLSILFMPYDIYCEISSPSQTFILPLPVISNLQPPPPPIPELSVPRKAETFSFHSR